MKSFTATDRDRGLRRLRRLTFGAVTGATMALLGISYVAAASYAGKASTASTTALNTSTSISTALTAASATHGVVDPTIGRAIRIAGYDDDFARIAGDRGPIALRAATVPGWQVVRVDSAAKTVHLPEGVELDLGSTGKALAADLA